MTQGTNTFAFKQANLLLLDRAFLRQQDLSPKQAESLREAAEAAYRQPNFSVVREKRLAPSGDPHDYVSLAPYFWPNPDTADGLPWVMRDGQINPERDRGDSIPLFNFCIAARTLGLAYHFFHEARYRQRLEELICHWFIQPASRMNPHLSYTQYVPGVSDGNCWGLIDTNLLPGVLDVCELIAADLDAELVQRLRQWFATFATWFIDSELGQGEANMHNNHASWHLMQSVAYLSFAGRSDLAQVRLQEHAENLINNQIEESGAQPHELARTQSFSYSCFNLAALLGIAMQAERLQVALPATFKTGCLAAARFMRTHSTAELWTWPTLGPIDSSRLASLFGICYNCFNDAELQQAAHALAKQHGLDQHYQYALINVR